MSGKVYVQKFPPVWESSASMDSNGSQTSGSFWSYGYARLVGLVISSASAKAGSGLRVWQSPDGGANWDYFSDWAPSACSGSAFSIEIIGDAAMIDFRNGATAANLFRTLWQLRPI